jgi:hypothetical protein
MNRGTKFEDRASSSQGKHEGESSAHLCDRLCRTRDLSQRQLPTDQDYAVSTREYQTDQSSSKPAPAVANPVFDKRKKQRQRQKQPHRLAGIDRVTPYQVRRACGTFACTWLGEGLSGSRASAQWQSGAGEWDAARAPASRQGSDLTRTDSALVGGSDSGSGVDA